MHKMNVFKSGTESADEVNEQEDVNNNNDIANKNDKKSMTS